MSDTYIHGCPRSLSSNFRCEVWTPCPIVPNSPQFPLNSPSTPPQLPSVGCTMTGCQHLSVAPFSVKHFTRVHVCDKFPVLKKWRGQYVWLEILSPKFHRYDVEIFQLYFHLCFIWSRGHRFLEQRFTIAKHSEMCIVYRTVLRNQTCRYQKCSILFSHVHLQLVCSVLLCLILVCIVWPYMHRWGTV